jgi:SAM-dependent methyltransferase
LSLPTDTPLNSVLVVCPQGFDLSPLPADSLLRMEYSFSDSYPADGFAAWQIESAPGILKVDVADTCRSYRGGFSQQGLNRFFAAALLEHRVSAALIVGLAGCTVDLSRLAALLDTPCALLLGEPVEDLSSVDNSAKQWICDALSRYELVCAISPAAKQQWSSDWVAEEKWGGDEQLASFIVSAVQSPKTDRSFDYSTYEFCQRDHPLLKRMQQPDTVHFAGCNKVLDLGCGVGIFLDCLRQEGIAGLGVERDPAIAEYGRGMDLDVVQADALDFLQNTEEQFDGIYCSHFVEHLPFDLVKTLLDFIAHRLLPGGVAVLCFPDPESIRSQLLGFWRDPEHVRFYHPELITTLAVSAGLELEWSSYEAQPHRVVSFPEEAPALANEIPSPVLPVGEDARGSGNWLESLMSKLGFVPRQRLDALEQGLGQWAKEIHKVMEQQQLINSQLEKRTDSLWAVNRTWAWNDNATLRLRRPSA